jgi:hypothetical protein
MRRRMVSALALAVMIFGWVNTSYAQTPLETKAKVRTVKVRFDCNRSGHTIVRVNQGHEITLVTYGCTGVPRGQLRKFITQKTLGQVVTVQEFPSRLIIPKGDIILPNGESLDALVTAKFPRPQ